MTWGLNENGINVPTQDEFLTLIRDNLDANDGLAHDYERDTFLGGITLVQAEQNAEAAQTLEAAYDGLDVNNNTGIQQDNTLVLVGLEREPATFSRATVDLTGTTGTFIPRGSIVEGGGDEGDARWDTTADVTLAAGVGEVIVEAELSGAIVALATEISKIVTPVSGWDTVNNPLNAETGDPRESNDTVRARRGASLQVAGSASTNSIRAKVDALNYITSAVCIENDDGAIQVVEGITMNPNSIALVVYPTTITDAQKQEVAQVLYENTVSGIETMGTGVVASVTDITGATKTVAYYFATTIPVNVVIVLVLETGFVIGDVDTAMKEAITAYFGGLAVGDDVTLLDITTLAGGIEGIRGVTSLTLNAVAADVGLTITQLGTEGTVSVT